MDTTLKKHVVIVVIAFLFFGVGYYAYTKLDNEPVVIQENPLPEGAGTQNPPADQESPNPPESSDGTPGQNVSQNIITYTDNGYQPNSITVKKGTTVVFKNNSAKSMWPATARHPDHTVYEGTTLAEHCPDADNSAFDACQGIEAGGSWAFRFDKTGTWRYHDHITPSFFGSVTVTE